LNLLDFNSRAVKITQFVQEFGSEGYCLMNSAGDDQGGERPLHGESPIPEKFPTLRVMVTGFFMGLANLVPGVSGGTMVLALGLYEDFIQAVSDLTRLRFNRRSVLLLMVLAGTASLTILGLAGVLQYLMEYHLSFMLALFIGMTLGGAPILYRQIRPYDLPSCICAGIGFALMAVIAFMIEPDHVNPSWFLFFLGGLVGSSAMILPGISGSYMLLIMGLYLPIITAISNWKDACKNLDIHSIISTGLSVILPVGLGLVAGIVLLANLLKYLLVRFHCQTIGFLIGLLVGSVMGLYPFKSTDVGKMIKYSHESSGLHILSIQAHGLDQAGGRMIAEKLDRLQSSALRVDINHHPSSAEITGDLLEKAAEHQAVMLVYDMNIGKSVRKAAGEMTSLDLVFIPNTQFSLIRTVICVLLLIIGFFLTTFLGKIGSGSGDGNGSNTAVQAGPDPA
jgi:putative membrane protein